MTDNFLGPFDPGALRYFSQISTLIVAVVATGSVLSPLWRHQPARAGLFRGAAATYGGLTMIVFPTLLGGDYSEPYSLMEHLVVPLLALVDAVVVGRSPRRPGWWWPFAWLVVPLAYLPLYVVASAQTGPLYDFLVPGASDFGVWVAILLVGLLVIGYLIWALALVRRRLLPPRS